MLYFKDIFCKIGMLRNDILINGNEQLNRNARKAIGLKNNEKLILYAPTHRKTSDDCFKNFISISYQIDCKRACTALKKDLVGNGFCYETSSLHC